ncbi:MAG TPA: alpha/beta hydrolase [Flavitalea sp.]|nr:alpha/beta hydrolase [Flavitalea sp.]
MVIRETISIGNILSTVILFLQLNFPASAQSDSAGKQFAPRGQLIDIGGWRLHIYGNAYDSLKGPAVILEAGIGSFSFDWDLVQTQLAPHTNVYSYDRAGSAWSDLGPRPHTMHQAVYDLHTLLHKAQIPGPYILAGASYGGRLVRLFAQQYPGEVAGVILVDSPPETSPLLINGKLIRADTADSGRPIPQIKTRATEDDNNLVKTPEGRQFMQNAIGNISPTIDPPYDRLPYPIQQTRIWAKQQLEYYAANDNTHTMEEMAQMNRDREKRPGMLGDIPLMVLTRGISDRPASDPAEQERKKEQHGLLSLSKNSKQIIAEKSGHHIQLDQPELVSDAIKQVIESVIKKQKIR